MSFFWGTLKMIKGHSTWTHKCTGKKKKDRETDNSTTTQMKTQKHIKILKPKVWILFLWYQEYLIKFFLC